MEESEMTKVRVLYFGDLYIYNSNFTSNRAFNWGGAIVSITDVKKHNLKRFKHIDFSNINDIVRSDVVRDFIGALEKDNKEEKKK